MSKREFAMMVTRVFAMITFFQALTQIELVVAGAMQLFNDYGDHRTRLESMAVFMASFIPFMLLLMLSILLWMKAWKIAALLLRGVALPDDPCFRAGGRGVQRIIFSALGLYLLTDALPKVAGATYIYMSVRHTAVEPLVISPPWKAAALEVFIQLVTGTALVVLPGTIISWLERSLKPPITEDAVSLTPAGAEGTRLP